MIGIARIAPHICSHDAGGLLESAAEGRMKQLLAPLLAAGVLEEGGSAGAQRQGAPTLPTLLRADCSCCAFHRSLREHDTAPSEDVRQMVRRPAMTGCTCQLRAGAVAAGVGRLQGKARLLLAAPVLT